MAKRIGTFSRIFINLKNSLFSVKQKDTFVGSDKFGNMYFEKLGDEAHNLRASRYIKQKDPQNVDIPETPVEWEAWLRGRRKNPPSVEEIESNDIKRIQTKNRAEELERKFSGRKISEPSPSAKVITENIVPSQDRNPFPQYEEYELTPGEKYSSTDKIK
uniref:NADH dehydrogenase [ubiquinone] 1 alpha subcomplex assembly factor 2 n=1 Tax=Biomphalaria glabrata TaxID=6526 RepID=A0A2C9LYR3_BIOGL